MLARDLRTTEMFCARFGVTDGMLLHGVDTVHLLEQEL